MTSKECREAANKFILGEPRNSKALWEIAAQLADLNEILRSKSIFEHVFGK